MELLFLEHNYRWLVHGDALLFDSAAAETNRSQLRWRHLGTHPSALPTDLRSILAAGFQNIIPMNDAIKQAFTKEGAVDGATVIRGHHVRVA